MRNTASMHAVYSYFDVLFFSLLLHNQVKRFGNPTWRKLVKAVDDPVGGNNHALALKIAAEHPGMQPSSNTYYSIIMVTSPCELNFHKVIRNVASKLNSLFLAFSIIILTVNRTSSGLHPSPLLASLNYY